MKKLALILCMSAIAFTAYASKKSNNASEQMTSFFKTEENLKVSDVNANKSSYSNSGYESTKSSVRDKIIDFAKTKMGSTYVWGATGPNVFDCSGFVRFVFQNAADISLPRVSSDQATYKPRISSMNMKKGDLVFFETTGRGRISHVGIYMGDSQFIHASSGGKRVMVSSLDGGYYNKAFRWAINPF
ncbi:MAG: C40 family peptidase [Sebaldella sp.]|nr:C40 family peptidase [Sebaldella sp.]